MLNIGTLLLYCLTSRVIIFHYYNVSLQFQLMNSLKDQEKEDKQFKVGNRQGSKEGFKRPRLPELAVVCHSLDGHMIGSFCTTGDL